MVGGPVVIHSWAWTRQGAKRTGYRDSRLHRAVVRIPEVLLGLEWMC